MALVDETSEPEDENDQALAIAEGRDLDAPTPVALRSRPWYEYLPNWIPKRIRNSIIELSKVTWPTSKETVDKTVTVIVFAVIFALVFFAIDQLFTTGLGAITDRIVTK
ncbi:MAG: preprotein translocase subunit SecE [Ktedonobacterales bacterium]|nr:preprotein translocase subunit SecE [Ktedonobacterales bacterium]